MERRSQWMRMTEEQKQRSRDTKKLWRQKTTFWWKRKNPEREQTRVRQIVESVRRWRQANPERVKAQRLVFVEIRAGRMQRGVCECGGKGEAHHEDYSKPLDVIWVCKKHHRAMDASRRARENEC